RRGEGGPWGQGGVLAAHRADRNGGGGRPGRPRRFVAVGLADVEAEALPALREEALRVGERVLVARLHVLRRDQHLVDRVDVVFGLRVDRGVLRPEELEELICCEPAAWRV